MGEVMGGPHKEGAVSLSAPREDRARARPSANGKSQELTGLASRARVSSPECETSARGLRGFTAAPVPEQAVGPALLSGLTRGVGTRPGRRRVSGQSHRQFLAPRAGPRAIAAALGRRPGRSSGCCSGGGLGWPWRSQLSPAVGASGEGTRVRSCCRDGGQCNESDDWHD